MPHTNSNRFSTESVNYLPFQRSPIADPNHDPACLCQPLQTRRTHGTHVPGQVNADLDIEQRTYSSVCSRRRRMVERTVTEDPVLRVYAPPA